MPKDKIEAKGKKREEAIMLLNHKEALKAIVAPPEYCRTISLSRMEDVHSHSLLISYIQPFVDGNKRTSRLMSNAMLIANGSCPLSFRTVDR